MPRVASRVVSVDVPGRGLPGASADAVGAEAWVLLEALIVEAHAFGGVDARAPMRRDVVRVVRRRPRRRR